jgi:superfamily I DNA and/or RNA helicase
MLTPYNAQVGVLEALLPGVTVATVNAFQGREVPVMVVSWVRSNTDGELGFVADPRRLTVTLTRARRLLVQVGDSATLAGHPRFSAAIDHIAATGGLRSVFEPPWDDALPDG